MKELEAPEIWGYTTFCDDLRFEFDGKITLVGSYHGVMYVRTAFPVTLPKFAISTVFNQRKTVFESKLRLKMFLPGDPDDEPSIVVEIEPPADTPAVNSERPNISARANVILASLVIPSAGTLKVRVERLGELHPVGSLMIVAADPVSFPTDASSAS
jgi:hypothetical protein